MSRQDLFKRILAALHASALGDTPWTAASKAIDEFCGTKGNHLVYGEGTAVDGIDIFFAEFCFRGERDEEMERLYFGTYHPMDERLPRIRTLPDSKLVHVQSLFSDEEKKSSATYNEALVFGEARDGLNVRLDGPAGSHRVDAERSGRPRRLDDGAARRGRERAPPASPVRAGAPRADGSARARRFAHRAPRQHQDRRHPARPERARRSRERSRAGIAGRRRRTASGGRTPARVAARRRRSTSAAHRAGALGPRRGRARGARCS